MVRLNRPHFCCDALWLKGALSDRATIGIGIVIGRTSRNAENNVNPQQYTISRIQDLPDLVVLVEPLFVARR